MDLAVTAIMTKALLLAYVNWALLVGVRSEEGKWLKLKTVSDLVTNRSVLKIVSDLIRDKVV